MRPRPTARRMERPMDSERTLVAEPGGDPDMLGLNMEPAAAEICASRGLRAHLTTAVRLIQRHFAGVTRLRCEALEAHETDERWVLLRFGVGGSVDEAMAAYDRFVDEWVADVPWPERDRISILFEPA